MASTQRQQQRTELDQRIDGKIDELVAQTGQQKQGASEIHQTLGEQIEQTKDINNHMDRAQTQVDKANLAVGKIVVTTDSWIAWGLIILLIIAIILVWALGKPIKKKA